MDQPGLAAQLYVTTGVTQAVSVGLAFVAQRVVLGDDDQRAGQDVEVGPRPPRLSLPSGFF